MEIPKNGFIDLHVHLDGSLSFDMARELANIQGMEIKSEKELKKLMVAPKDCRDLNDYLTKFDYPLKLLQTEKAITYSVYELLKIQKLQGLVYSEIRFAPQLHTRKGLSQEQIVAAALRGTQGFSCGLILCCMRGANNQAMNLETLEAAEKYMGKGVVALDLAGAEALFPTENFEELFRKAGKRGYHSQSMPGRRPDRRVYGRLWNSARQGLVTVYGAWKIKCLFSVWHRIRFLWNYVRQAI